jgi:hypothetical protein
VGFVAGKNGPVETMQHCRRREGTAEIAVRIAALVLPRVSLEFGVRVRSIWGRRACGEAARRPLRVGGWEADRGTPGRVGLTRT